MGQVLRITVGTADYSFKLVNVDRTELWIELNGRTHVLKREGFSWVDAEAGALSPQLAESIGKAVALRYRI